MCLRWCLRAAPIPALRSKRRRRSEADVRPKSDSGTLRRIDKKPRSFTMRCGETSMAEVTTTHLPNSGASGSRPHCLDRDKTRTRRTCGRATGQCQSERRSVRGDLEIAADLQKGGRHLGATPAIGSAPKPDVCSFPRPRRRECGFP